MATTKEAKVKYTNRYGVEKWVTAKQAANWARQHEVMRETNRRAAEMRKQSKSANRAYKSYLRAAKQMTDETEEAKKPQKAKRKNREYVTYTNRQGVKKRVTKKQAANWARQREVMMRTNYGVGEGRSRKDAAQRAREEISAIDTAVWDNFFLQLVGTLQAEIDRIEKKRLREQAQMLLETVKGEEGELTEKGKTSAGAYLQEENRGVELQELITRIVYASQQTGVSLYNKYWIPFIEMLNNTDIDDNGAFKELTDILRENEDLYADDEEGWEF